MGKAERFAAAESRIVWSSDPVQEPISPTELRQVLRIDHGDEDSLLAELIRSAREQLELECRLALVRKTGTLYLDSFLSTILIRAVPVLSVETVKYWDLDETLQTVSSSDWRSEVNLLPPRVEPITSWTASTSERPAPVQIAFTAGYTPATCPPIAKQAIRMMAAHQYRYREAGCPQAQAAAVDFSWRSMVAALQWGSYAE